MLRLPEVVTNTWPTFLPSDSSSAQRSESRSIAASSSLVTFCMRMRLAWKLKRSGRICSRARSMAGISVSMVVLELGTICPMR